MPSIHILVVEDYQAFRRAVCSILRQRPEFQVAEASDGLEAVRKTEQLQPELVLLDIGLPYLNGIDVCRCARKVSPAAKIMFLSQESSPEIVHEALCAGGLGYVQKSRAQSDLLTAIDSVLKGKRFMSRGLIDLPLQNGQNSKEPEYPWQQKVMDAFRAAPDSLPLRINMTERAIAARLKDPSQTDLDEHLALKCALRSLGTLIDETRPEPKVSEKEAVA
jgi:DNA-binding NarL/FixJ family response regulator